MMCYYLNFQVQGQRFNIQNVVCSRLGRTANCIISSDFAVHTAISTKTYFHIIHTSIRINGITFHEASCSERFAGCKTYIRPVAVNSVDSMSSIINLTITTIWQSIAVRGLLVDGQCCFPLTRNEPHNCAKPSMPTCDHFCLSL